MIIPKLLIIEGPDCSGKSTLAKHAALQLNAAYFHASGAKSLHIAMHDYHMSLLHDASINLKQGRSVVFDRHWPSEYCYGQVLRPHLSDRVYHFPDILAACALLNPTYVFCMDEVCSERHDLSKDVDHPYSKDQHLLICQEYRHLAKEMSDSPALPNMHHPKTPPILMSFRTVRYSLLEDGKTMGTFVDAL